MTGRRLAKRRENTMAAVEPLSKTHKAVAKWMRRNVPTKKTKFLNTHVVNYFVGSKAVDMLINDSPWSKAKAKEGSEPIFECREYTAQYLDELLKHKMYHRAKKIPVPEKQAKKSKTKDSLKEPSVKDSPKSSSNEKSSPTPKEGKKKRKIRLDMHLDQIFLDSQDAYIWLYDPIPWYYWLGGGAIVLGIIAVCMFPLWPPMMRKGVHYLSIAAAGFLVFIIGLAVLQYCIFGLLFALSGGKLKFWIFPNLTEDVGFVESFFPLYDYTYIGDKKKKAKDSDDEESDDEEDEDEDDNDKKDQNENDEDSSSSGKSSTEKNFEMVNQNGTEEKET